MRPIVIADEEVTDSAVRVAPASVSAEGDICPEAMDEVLVPWDMVRRASRIHIFRQPQKPGKQPARKAAKAAPQGDAPKKGKGKSGKSKLGIIPCNTSVFPRLIEVSAKDKTYMRPQGRFVITRP